jgi:hypothetical protein
VLEHLVAWSNGTPPPRADPVVVTVAPGFRRDPEGIDFSGVRVVVDRDDHALGGLRHLEVEVPVARTAADPSGPQTIRTWRRTPFSDAELRRRYGSAEGLRERATRAADDLVRRGWLLAADAPAAVDELCSVWDGRAG